MKNTALVVIDIQQLLIDEKPYKKDELLSVINKAIAYFRAENLPIIFIQHTDGELVKYSDNWQVAKELDKRDGDICFSKNNSSMFKDTLLDAHLKDNKIERLLICGMQTEYCVDASAKAAFDRGYEVHILKNGYSTFDNEKMKAADINDFFSYIWQGFAETEDAEDLNF